MPARLWQVLITSMTMRTSPDKQCSVTPANTEETCHSHWDFLAAPQKAEHRALLLYLSFVLFREKSTLNTNGRNQTMQFFTLVAKRMFKEKKKNSKDHLPLLQHCSPLIYNNPPSEIHHFQNTSFFSGMRTQIQNENITWMQLSPWCQNRNRI